MPVGSGLILGFSADVNYTGSELTDSKSNPHGRSPERALLDATVCVSPEDDRWEVALIGRNLTDQHYWVSSQDVPLSGTPGGTATGTLADLFAVVSRGREIMLRLTYKFAQ